MRDLFAHHGAVAGRIEGRSGRRQRVRALVGDSTRELGPGAVIAEGTVVVVDKRGRLVARLAEADSARAALYGILAGAGIDPLYRPDVQHEVARIAARSNIANGTVDRSAIPFVTIDNEDSRDLDQALHVARCGEGYIVHYALADASFYVRPGSALLDESLARGTSYYLPGMAVPMLPRRLSEDLVSLNPEVTRRALLFVITLDREARAVQTRIERARIRSRAKLTYAGVQAHYDSPHTSTLALRPFTESLALLREVGEKRLADAARRDVVAYSRRELSLSLSDLRGSAFRARLRQRLDSERYNEQISLLCNTEGAALLLSAEDAAQPIFRVHRPPPAERVTRMRETVEAIVDAHELPRERWCWGGDDAESLADYLERLPRRGAEARLRVAIERQLRYVNQASRFEDAPGPHHALGVEAYARFSAPMREVVGIVTHKEALEITGAVSPPAPAADDLALRERAIEVANAAKKRQRAINKAARGLAIDQYLAEDLPLPMSQRPLRRATVMGVSRSRLYVDLDDFAIELKVYTRDIEAMTGARYVAEGPVLRPAEAGSDSQVPVFRVGDGVTLRVKGRERGKWQLWPEPLDDRD